MIIREQIERAAQAILDAEKQRSEVDRIASRYQAAAVLVEHGELFAAADKMQFTLTRVAEQAEGIIEQLKEGKIGDSFLVRLHLRQIAEECREVVRLSKPKDQR